MKKKIYSRKMVAALSSSAGIVQQLTQVVGGFVYRTIFLMVLAKEYFGINGLFTNILQMFSLTELGIGTALLYSLHKQYASRDMETIRGLVSFYKKIYSLVAVAVLVLGISFYPFIGSVVDISEVPPDVNLGRIYFLFLIQNVVGYLFAYRRSVLEANQQQYIDYLVSSGILLVGYIVRTIALVIWKNFEILLLLGIASDILLEWIFYLWIGHRHRTVFTGKGSVPEEEKREIYKNTAGLMCHKIGSIVVTSTDSIVLSKYVSLAAVGIYSNYITLVSAVSGIVTRVFYGIQPTITNYVVEKPREDSRELLFRILYINMWIASFTTVCLYLLLNPFIGYIWLDETFLFGKEVVMLICLQHYISLSRLTSGCFVNGCGLFDKDKVRALIESAINLGVSVVLAKRIGIAGVFVGTCVSGLLTYYWRQPYLIFQNYFGKGLLRYWLVMLFWFALTAAMCFLGDMAFQWIPNTFQGFIVKMLAAGIGSNLVILLLTFRSEGFRYMWEILMGILRK
ncbi:MAG: oligosaccharide flippase family protein [Oscillospiraceae bacterium]|nr:oligosaccharide flippase family protein [Oscillospiraceae bacterium]MBQ7130162.1 oligosaccharide flippase family protein [Oscillospiraceae bacterium]